MANLRFSDHVLLRFADTIIFCRLKTSANPQINNLSPYKYELKMLSFTLKDDFWFLGHFWDLDRKHWFVPCKFADLRFADRDTKEIFGFAICGLAHLRNLRICDSGMSPRVCGFAICGLNKKNLRAPFGYMMIHRSSSQFALRNPLKDLANIPPSSYSPYNFLLSYAPVLKRTLTDKCRRVDCSPSCDVRPGRRCPSWSSPPAEPCPC